MVEDFLVVLTTINEKEKAEELARLIIEKRLAACVNISEKGLSFFQWKGKIEVESEYTLVIKTTSGAFPDLQTLITTNHPYELPEIIAVKIAAGKEKYLNWIKDSLKK